MPHFTKTCALGAPQAPGLLCALVRLEPFKTMVGKYGEVVLSRSGGKARCMLHNFAGNIEMYGILDAVASGPVEARTSENSTMASL